MNLIITSVLVLVSWKIVPLLGTRSGPFKASLTRVGPCANPTLPVEPESSTFFYAELYNTSSDTNLLRGNITVVKDHRMKKVKIKGYVWEGNKWNLKYQFNNLGCNSAYLPALIKVAGMNYDAKTCTFVKGVNLLNNININKLQHTWASSQEYGKMLWRLEFFSDAGSIFCQEFEMLNERLMT